MTARQVSTILRRLREHGIVKKIGGTFKYYLTALGRRITATGLKLREMGPSFPCCAGSSRPTFDKRTRFVVI